MTTDPSNRRTRLPPTTFIAIAVVIGLALAVAVTAFALERPWIGLELTFDASKQGAVVRHSEGPGAVIPVGTVLVEVSNGADSVKLERLDLTTEPDGTIHDYKSYRRFLERQERLARIQSSPEMVFTDVEGRFFKLAPNRDGRPAISLPVNFWVQIMVGLIAWVVSSAVFAFRSREASARYLLLSGAATLIFAPMAAVYTTRELAVPGTLFQWASDLNFFGGSLFAASFVALLLHYPRRIAPTWVGVGVVALYVIWFVLQQVDVFESMTFARRFLVMIGVLTTFILAGIHWFGTRKDPVARAALQWFLLSWMFGTSLFAVFILLPQTFGVDTTPIQGYAFLLFLLVYGGLAFGILRYRLFDLGKWWRRIVVWTMAVLFLVLLDMFFLFGLHLSSGVSLSLTLLVCGIVWLPLRDWIWGRLMERRNISHGDSFGKVLAVALSPSGDQTMRWQQVMENAFDPLHIVTTEPVSTVSIERDGLALSLPGVQSIPPLRLEYAHAGQQLFTPRDAEFAKELVAMLGHAIESRTAYENGAVEERRRIARDMHDNIGAQLLSALHSRDPERKDVTIREALSDLRDIINNAAQAGLSFDEMLADLRVETIERLAGAGIALQWTSNAHDCLSLEPSRAHALRSIIREAVSNAIKHADAQNIRVAIHHQKGEVTLQIDDDGKGFDATVVQAGHGLANIQARLAGLGGKLQVERKESGSCLLARFPVLNRKTGT